MTMKILVLRFSSIGDIVLTTPVVRALKQQAGAEVHFVVKKQFRQVVENNPFIDKIFDFEKDIPELIPLLKKEGYDHILDLHKNLRTARLKSALGVNSHSFNKLNIEKWLLVNLKINALPGVHIVDRYFAAAAFAGVKYDGRGLDYFITGQDREAVEQLLPEEYNVFVTGGAHFTKQIPSGHLITIGNNSRLPVVLLGGSDDVGKAAAIADALGDKAVNLTGKLSLNRSAAVIEKAAAVFTADTGLMHIAAAFRRRVVSFWGNTVPQFGMYPFFPDGMENLSEIMEVKNLRCRPCSKIGYDKCPKKHFRCMMDIEVNNLAMEQ